MKKDNKFIRIIDNKKYYFENGEQFLLTSELKTKFISKTKKSKDLVNNFITIDIETYIVDGLMTPYLICFYDGKNFYYFYLSDYNSVEEMMLNCLKSILIRKYKENGQYKIEFKDSLLLLLTSLKSLCSCFKIDESKSIFPHLFVNENNLDYNGEVPNINNFIKISKDEYQYYKLNYSN